MMGRRKGKRGNSSQSVPVDSWPASHERSSGQMHQEHSMEPSAKSSSSGRWSVSDSDFSAGGRRPGQGSGLSTGTDVIHLESDSSSSEDVIDLVSSSEEARNEGKHPSKRKKLSSEAKDASGTEKHKDGKKEKRRQREEFTATRQKRHSSSDDDQPAKKRSLLYSIGKEDPDTAVKEVVRKETIVTAAELGGKIPKSIRDRIFKGKGSQAVVLLNHPEELILQGKVKVQCLLGSIEIYGHIIDAGKKEYSVFSSESHSLITVNTRKGSAGQISRDKLETLFCSEKEQKKFCAIPHGQSVVILLRRLDSVVCDFVTKCPPFQRLFTGGKYDRENSILLKDVNVQLVTDPCHSVMKFGGEYRNVGKELTQKIRSEKPPAFVVCGGKNVGKSTMVRYLINTALNSCASVAYLECDIGQTEFTPSGCLSLSMVTEPLLGPPFTHVRKPLSSCFLGALTPGDNPAHYMECVRFVSRKYWEMEPRPPLIVNTMGWNKGLGVNLLVDTLRLCQPDIVIQLDSMSRGKNYPPITTDFVKDAAGWLPMPEEPDGSRQQKVHQLITIPSPVSPNLDNDDQYKPPDHRNLTLLAYLGQMIPEKASSLSMMALKPHKVPWEAVAVHVCHTVVPNSQVMYALNASVVALCHVDEDQMLKPDQAGCPRFLPGTPVCQCLGLGVIRGIHPVEKVFYLLTPILQAELQSVNCLLRGSLEFPQPLLIPKGCSVELPYVGYPKDVIGASSVKRRRHLLRQQRRNRDGQ